VHTIHSKTALFNILCCLMLVSVFWSWVKGGPAGLVKKGVIQLCPVKRPANIAVLCSADVAGWRLKQTIGGGLSSLT